MKNTGGSYKIRANIKDVDGSSMFCKKCGTQFVEGTAFCSSCGTATDSPESVRSVAQLGQQASPTQPSASRSGYVPPSHSYTPQPQFEYQQYPQSVSTSYPGKGMSIAAMVLGICSLVIPYAGVAIAIVGLILGVLGKKKCTEASTPSGMAQAGIVMSIIALAWSILLVILCASCIGAVGCASLF